MKNDKDTSRVFFALLPDRNTVADINFHLNQFSPETGKKVRPENFHITLLFLGNVTRQHIDALCMDCDSIAVPAIDLTMTTPGWWKKAGILWLAPESIPPSLAKLHDALKTIAARRNLVHDKKEYLPHITLMRKVTAAPAYPVIRPFTWRASSFSLMQSNPRPDGVVYTELGRWPLMAAHSH